MSWRCLHPAAVRTLSEVVAPATSRANRLTFFACRRWLQDSARDNPSHSLSTPIGGRGGTADMIEEERTWTWSTPSPLRPGRGAAEIPVVPR